LKAAEDLIVTVLNAHFDGQHVILDEPAPVSLAPQTRVKVVIEDGGDSEPMSELARIACPGGLPPDFSRQHDRYLRDSEVLAEIEKLAVSIDDLPPDYSAQHDHYVKGTPRRPNT
jgi:hypothetical protein